MTFEGWLREQLDARCTTQAADIQKVIDDNLPRLMAMDGEKSEDFAAWFELEPEG